MEKLIFERNHYLFATNVANEMRVRLPKYDDKAKSFITIRRSDNTLQIVDMIDNRTIEGVSMMSDITYNELVNRMIEKSTFYLRNKEEVMLVTQNLETDSVGGVCKKVLLESSELPLGDFSGLLANNTLKMYKQFGIEALI